MADPIYPSHRPWELEPHYSRHVSAMTTEQLHHKADIAEQLAWRDQVIESLRARVDELESKLRGALHAVQDIRAGLREGA